MVSNTITITYGDQAENHVGMQKIGKLAVSGLTIDDLQMAKERFEKIDCKCELINLNEYVDECKSNIDPAAILIIRNGINKLLSDKISDDMYFEQNKLDVDKKAFMYGRVVNKHARHNLCFDDNNQEPDYVNGKGRIVSWENVPLTNKIRKLLPDYFGPKTNNLTAM